MPKGLYKKYLVYKADTGEEVKEDCFVLIPAKDEAARKALLAYATATEDKTLGEDLMKWLQSLKEVNQ